VDGDVALSLALVKRMREVATGVPALVSWQWFEMRRAQRGPDVRVRDYGPPGI
jgi:hypothetical protein